MMRDRYDAALLFLPRCVWHRFRELDGFNVRPCRSGADFRSALVHRPWRSMTRCSSTASPRSSSRASDCRTPYAP
jgi:hypothetical protein